MRASFLLVLPALVAGAALAKQPLPREKPDLDTLIPRRVSVSIGTDHVWGQVKSTVAPADRGKDDWSEWDRNGDGALQGAELQSLAGSLAEAEVEFLSVTVNGRWLPFPTFVAKVDGGVADARPLDAPISFQVSGRMTLLLDRGAHEFALYGLPDDEDGVLPLRLSFARPYKVLDATGARAELRMGGRRIEGAATQATPTLWGRFERF